VTSVERPSSVHQTRPIAHPEPLTSIAPPFQ
jgi:hypothetical protein